MSKCSQRQLLSVVSGRICNVLCKVFPVTANLEHEILLRLNLYEIDSSEQTPSTETTEPAEEQEVLDSEVVNDPVEPTRSDSHELNDMLKSAKRCRMEPTTPKLITV